MSTTALVTVNNRQLTPDIFQMIMQVAPIMHAARLFGSKTQEQAAAIMIKGHELGFSLSASFEYIHVIEEKPSLSPRGALALIQSNPDNAGVEIKHESDASGNPVGCSVTMKRKGGMTYTARFTIEDAKRAGLIKDKSGWEKYPLLMCQWRAVGYCADVVWADISLKRADEFGADLTPEGNVIEGSWSAVGSQQPAATPPAVSQSQPVPAMDPNRLQTLLSIHGATAIMDANSGKIPGSEIELDAIEAKLGAVSHE